MRDLLWVLQLPLAVLRGCRARLRSGNRLPSVSDFTQRIWNGDTTKYDTFVGTLRSSLPAGTRVYVSGSSATGRSFLSGQPFGPQSDIDLVLVGPSARSLFGPSAFRHLGQTTLPFPKEWSENAPELLTTLHRSLVEQAGREVSLVTMTPFYRRVLEFVNGPSMLLIVGADRDAEPTTAPDRAA